jgi:hypothetical protein
MSRRNSRTSPTRRRCPILPTRSGKVYARSNCFARHASINAVAKSRYSPKRRSGRRTRLGRRITPTNSTRPASGIKMRNGIRNKANATRSSGSADARPTFAQAAGRLRVGSASQYAASTIPTRAAAAPTKVPAAPASKFGHTDKTRVSPNRPIAKKPTRDRLTVIFDCCIS